MTGAVTLPTSWAGRSVPHTKGGYFKCLWCRCVIPLFYGIYTSLGKRVIHIHTNLIQEPYSGMMTEYNYTVPEFDPDRS